MSNVGKRCDCGNTISLGNFSIDCNGIKIPFNFDAEGWPHCLECNKKDWEAQLRRCCTSDFICLRGEKILVNWRLFWDYRSYQSVRSGVLHRLGILSSSPLGNWAIYKDNQRCVFHYMPYFTRKEDALALARKVFGPAGWDIRLISEIIRAEDVACDPAVDLGEQ